MKKNYVNSVELEEWWQGWLVTGDSKAWDMMADMIYKICEGVSVKFHPNMLADEGRITQVLLNLLDNAVKYTPERGSIRIVASKKDSFLQGL